MTSMKPTPNSGGSVYNPYQHAYDLGVKVAWGKLPAGLRGYYDHPTRTIWLREDLTVRVAHCVLAHEIVHAEFEDEFDSVPEAWRAKAEKRCDKIAAKRLVIWPQLVDAIKASEDPATWCAELSVMPWVLENFFADLTPQERIRLEEETGRSPISYEPAGA